jgi:hypothetical protein
MKSVTHFVLRLAFEAKKSEFVCHLREDLCG